MSQDDWDIISDVYLEVFLDTGDGYLHLGSDNIAQFNDAGDLIVTFDDNTWVAIDGHIVSFFAEQSQDANVSRGYVPAYVNGDEARLILVWNKENASVAGYERVYDTEVASRGLVPLKDGDTIELIGDFYTYEQAYDDQYIFDTFIVNGTPVVRYEDVGEGDCLVYYSLHDIYQNTYWTEPLLYSAQ